MSCPYLKEVVMLFCDAYPVKKMLPLDRIATAHPCLGQDFEQCPLFRELVARLACAAEAQTDTIAADERKACHVARNRADTGRAGRPGPARA